MPEEKMSSIQEEEYVRPTKWSFRRYLSETWHYKWWVLGASVALAVVGTLGVELLYNRSKRTYSTTFGLDLPYLSVSDNDTRGPTYTLYDDTRFASTDFYAENTLKKVIASSDAFSGLDAGKLASHGALTVNGITDKASGFTSTRPYTLTLSFRASDFQSPEQAKQFITSLIEYPIQLAKTALAGYSAVTPFYQDFSTFDFSNQISTLSNKKAAISSVYSSLLNSGTNAKSLRLEDGKTTLEEASENYRLSHLIGGLEDITVYSGQLETNRYLQFTNTETGIAQKVADLKGIAAIEITSVQKTIVDLADAQEAFHRLVELTSISSTDAVYSSEITRLNQTIETKTVALRNSLTHLERIGYSSGDPSLDIMDVKTVAQARKITELDSSAPVEKWGYLQYLANPTTNDWASKCATFGKTLEQAKAAYTRDLKAVNSHFVFLGSSQARSYVSTPSGIETKSGLNMWIGAVAGLILGYAASSLICTFVGIWKEDKEEAAGKPAEGK